MLRLSEFFALYFPHSCLVNAHLYSRQLCLVKLKTLLANPIKSWEVLDPATEQATRGIKLFYRQ